MSRKLHLGALIVAALALAATIAWACLYRGPWYDEFYTHYVTRPGTEGLAALRDSWLPDNHPPLFYALAWATNWLGAIQPHRLLNLAFGLLALIGGAAIVRDVPRLLPAASALVILLAGNEWTIRSATELRSYFLSLCIGAVVALSLAALFFTRQPGSPGRRATYTLSVLLAFNTHIVTTLVCAALIVPFILEGVLRRQPVAARTTPSGIDWRYLRALTVPPVIAGLLFVAVSLIQLPQWLSNTQVFWIESGFRFAFWSCVFAIQRSLEANFIIVLGALAGTWIIGRDILRERKSEEAIFLLVLGCGVVAGMALMIALHLVRPMLIEKYLTASIGAVSVGIALACGQFLQALRPLWTGTFLLIALALSCWNMTSHAAATVARNSWYGTGSFIARTVAKCPGALVHVDPFWNANLLAMSPADNRSVVPFGYRTVAAELGFALEPENSRRLATGCPTLFWAEHIPSRTFTDASIADHLRSRGFPVERLTVNHIGDGWVAAIELPPGQMRQNPAL